MSFNVRCGATFSGTIGGAYVLAGAGTDEALRTSGSYTGQAGVASALYTVSTSWQRISLSATAAVSLTTSQIGVIPIGNLIFSGTAGASDYIEIDDVQLELGAVATNFEQESFDTLIRKDHRRYYKSFPLATVPAQNAGVAGAYYFPPQAVAAATLTFGPMMPLPLYMRDVAGTITTFNPSATNAQIRNVTVNADCSATTATSATGANGLYIFFTSAAGSAAGNANAVHYVVDKRI